MNLDTSSQEPHKLTPMEGLSVLSNQIYPCQSVVSLCCRLILVLGELAFLKFFLKLYLGSWRDGLVLAEDQCSIPNTLMKVHNCPKTSYKIGKMWKSIGLFFFCRFPPSLPGCFTQISPLFHSLSSGILLSLGLLTASSRRLVYS